ncbi:MAG: DNA (cytosine-5-)-methyltransferase [Acidobacteriota bacterium]
MEYMTIQKAAEKWDISERRVQKLCVEGRLSEAKKFGRQWAIPTTTDKPSDARVKSGKYVKALASSEADHKEIRNERLSAQISTTNDKLGFSPEDVLEQINYKEIDKLIPNETYDFVDLFCGCGGMSYGFHKMADLTGRLRWAGAIDIDKHSIDTYARNYGHKPVNVDLAKEDVEVIKKSLDLDEHNELILIGCAPCQGFSAHSKKDRRGPDSRNTLVGRFAEIAVAMKPKLIIMENVPDLLARKHWHHYQAFKKTAEAAGYHIAVKILNMANYGTPQARFRTVLLASRDFIPTLPEPVFKPDQYRTVRDAIGNLPTLAAGEKDPDDPMHMTSKHRKETIDILKQVPKDGGNRPRGVGPKCLDKVGGFYDVYGRLAWDKTAVTITARCRTPSCGRFIHPEQDRGLSVREAGLLQGFPADFYFEGPFDDKYKQIGNAVSPIFSTRIAGHVLTMLAGHNWGDKIETIDAPYFSSFSGMIARAKNQGAESKD